ncbi:protein SanA, affects membrane permeability for vancomycin [Propionibacterium cyclohexanicum]|uniref:Protein SanA, affects membrane permeability for vancomycin n=1 Tax=Propionibacterium cyclohexanicum TaxID=64702 RepID=A0A1H9T498_9ACTN|nr:ElyC/SanA/YdcF family protein [Propionibacterium cyclohexanicum]SER91897.1 protein SanA, affects membrane permeability for vancomycin [Propionibacterium cyclohexanicum]
MSRTQLWSGKGAGGLAADADRGGGKAGVGTIGAVTARASTSRRRRWLATVVGGLLVAALVVVGGPWIWVRAVAHDKVFTSADAPRRDVALVLGAGLNADGTPSPYLRGRLDDARALYARGAVSVILVSGDNRTIEYSEPAAMASYLVARGVPSADVVADYAGLDTYDSCYRAKHIFGVESVTVLGQSYHIDRAVTTCRMVGMDAVGVGNEQSHSSRTWRRGQVRELGSNVKLVWDLATDRQPILGSQETSVREALARHGR